ncbi:ribosomal protein S18 acetylase RimI-like enzyme [Nonomuraea thailandensis]|uniref:Ribosomal protein S18 acetylase RimI-like enzyme n=1 Tax=Nonomuraea thailandensis TaxID=1188745 RepID=A0A9X2K1P9_9ACTN|nr:GNAT family N-acetyltransferase [Nonomuraea thailandensis]MCP2356215.1 ribosomal protein S18 acetylase RimI-like enzyme [Nonomuraea thailandensis]
MIDIRRATPDDASTVHALIHGLAGHQDQTWGVTVSVEDLKRMLARPDITYLIAERDGQAVGYVSWLERISFWSGQDYLHLDDLYVTGAERGHGVGERLMRAAAEAAGGKVIRWEVAEANEAAQRFYTRIGATLTSKKIGRWQPQ